MMNQWLRWKGILAFVAFCAVISVAWLFLIDGIIERSIEKYGTQALGAKVELGAADLSLFPAGLKLTRLQATNPDDTMKNAVEIDRISMSVDSGNLLRRKVIIDDMALTGVRFNTPRSTSGAIGTSKTGASTDKKPGAKTIGLPAMKIPSVKEILEKEELETLTLIRSAQEDIQTTREKWQQRLSELPDEKKFAKYKKRIKKATGGKKGSITGLLGSAGDMTSIQKEIQKDLENLKTAQNDIKKDITSLKNKVGKLSQAPMKDVNRLKEKYALTPEGLSNFSRLLMGEKIDQRLQKAITWYEKVKPILEKRKNMSDKPEEEKPVRGKGITVAFKEKESLPDFLIRRVDAGIALGIGDLAGKINNITPDQDVLGVPLTFSFFGEKLKGLESAQIDGTLDHIRPAKSKDQMTARVRGYALKDMVLSDSPDWPLTLSKATSNLDLNAALKGNKIKANIKAALTSAKLSGGSTTSDQSGPLAGAIASALAGISEFNMKARIKGPVDNYKVKVTSDIDNVLQNAVGNVVKTETAKLEKQLKAAVLEKVDGPMNETTGSMGGFDSIQGALKDRINLGDGLLSDSGLKF
jgi:uncharacterized protein (TIGR03545 family)